MKKIVKKRNPKIYASKTEQSEKIYCKGCNEPLVELHVGGFGAFSCFDPQTRYCENKLCKWFGVVVVGGRKKKKGNK